MINNCELWQHPSQGYTLHEADQQRAVLQQLDRHIWRQAIKASGISQLQWDTVSNHAVQVNNNNNKNVVFRNQCSFTGNCIWSQAVSEQWQSSLVLEVAQN